MQQLIGFSIGPVQSFIASSRKTTDLWGGSYLLSELTETAMTLIEREFGTDSVEWIQPQPDKSGKTRNKEMASYPNRFLCLVNSEQKETSFKLKNIEESLKNWLTKTGIESIKSLFYGKELNPYIFEQATNQLESALEIFWAFVPFENRDSYHEQRLEVESMLASVKNNRPIAYTVHNGLVCSVCKQREALTSELPTADKSHHKLKEDIRHLWETAWQDTSRAKQNEHLCAVCAVKRMRRKMLSLEPYPSVRAFNTPSLKDAPLDEEGNPVGMTDSEEERYYAVVFFDGDDMGQWISGAKSSAQKATIEDNKNLTENLSRFASEGVARAAKNRNVRVIYSGGDDVLAIGSIMDILSFTSDIRKSFSSSDTGLDERATGSAGIVIAPEKAPFQQVMIHGRQAESKAKGFHNELEGKKKDAFTIHFLRNAGQQRIMTLPFALPFPESTPDWFSLKDENLLTGLVRLAEKWTEIGLSPNFIHHFHREFKQVAAEQEFRNKHTESKVKPFQSSDEIELIRSELTRLLKQSAFNTNNTSKESVESLADELSSLYLVHQGNFLSYIHLLEMIRYFSHLPKTIEEVEQDV